MRTEKLIGLLLLLNLAMCGCSVSSEALATENPVGTAGLAQTQTENIPISTATKEHQPTNTIIPSPTYTLIPTEALSDTGPWLLYSKNESSQIIIRNLVDDSGIELKTPDAQEFSLVPGYRIFPDLISLSGGRFAILTYGSTSNYVDLSIYHLPVLEKEFQASLFPGEVAGYRQNEGNLDPVVYSQYLYAQSNELLLWSPDGRYLAFASDLLFPDHQLITYDTQTGNQEILFESDQFIRIIDWSPDGEHLLFFTTERSEPFREKHPIYSVAISSGRSIAIGTASHSTWSVIPIGWLNDNQLVVIDNIWDDSPYNLRLLDINLESEIILYPHRVGEAAFDPVSSTLIFDIWKLAWMMEPNPQPKELQIISFPNLEITSLPLSNYSDTIWHDSLGLFSAEGNDTLILFDADGKIILEFPNTPQEPARIYPSPDGQYLLVDIENTLSLMTVDGDLVHKFPDVAMVRVLWMPDSEGFFWSIYSDSREDLYRCTAADQWQQELIDTEIESHDLMLINE